MGLEALCTATYKKQRSEGKAHLNTSALEFRGDFRLDIPFQAMTSAEARKGGLVVKFGREQASFALGAAAEKWALKIRYPRSRAQKLGLKKDLKVALIGLDDEDLHRELGEAGAVVGGHAKSDLIFYQVAVLADLDRLRELRKSIQPAGAIWVVAPKGSKTVRESGILSFARGLGLTDTKVVSFTDTLTAHKFMIPVGQR